MLYKVYAKSSLPERRFAPQVCIMAKKTPVFGNPDKDLICTSHIERQNLNIRLPFNIYLLVDQCHQRRQTVRGENDSIWNS